MSEEYAFCEYSLAFPILTAAAINHFLQQVETMEDDNAMIRELRIWVREQLQSQPN